MTELGTAADAHRLTRTNPNSVGWGNFAFGHVPTSGAKTLNGYLTTLGGNVAFSALQKMRESSPTGGALGNVTVPELEMLRSSEAPIDPQIDPDTFRTSLATIMDNRKRVLFKIPGGREAYREWRKRWLGYDPYVPKNKRGKASGSKPKGGGSWSITEVE